MKKTFYCLDNVGKAKYTVNFHDGVQTHRDGSPFFGIATFKNKQKKEEFIRQLVTEGYTTRNTNSIDFEPITLRSQITSRGGGIEISLDTLGWPEVRMTAYQNYLGGGLLGRVCNSCTISDWYNVPELVEIAEQLKKYFFYLTNPEEGSWEHLTYEQNQASPVSAY